MRTDERSRETTASAETVWRIWSNPATWHEWNPNVASMQLNGPFANGTTGIMATRAGRNHQIRFTDIQPGRSFTLETRVIPLSVFLFHCQIAPGTSGKTRISQSIGVGGPMGAIFGPMMGSRIADSFVPLLDGLAAKAEGAPRA